MFLQIFQPLSRTWTAEVRHTLTGDSSIFRVGAVMYTKWIRGAVYKSCFSPSTFHLVQEDGSSSLAKEGLGTKNCPCNQCDTSHISCLKWRLQNNNRSTTENWCLIQSLLFATICRCIKGCWGDWVYGRQALQQLYNMPLKLTPHRSTSIRSTAFQLTTISAV